MGIDGAYLRASHKRGHFEAIIGKSVLAFRRDDKESKPSEKRFGFIQNFDTKPRRRLFNLLKSQGMQENQQVIFLSHFLNPQAEHLLDWFHVTMRITTMKQAARGLPKMAGTDEAFELREKHLAVPGEVRTIQVSRLPAR